MGRHDRLWQAWGEGDPHYAVLSDPRFGRRHMNADAETEFFTSGEEYVAHVLAEGERRLGPLPRASALDYGCGLGRLALALAPAYTRVTGADIAPAMLTRARALAQARGVSNIEFLPSADGRGLSGPFDLVHTVLVLQHVPPRPALTILGRLAAQVSPGGVAIINLTCWRSAPAWRRAHSLLKRRLRPYDFALTWLQGRNPRRPSIPMYVHNLGRVVSLLTASGAANISLELVPQPAGFESVTVYYRRAVGPREGS